MACLPKPRVKASSCSQEETYLGCPFPAVVYVTACGHARLNGEYRQERREGLNAFGSVSLKVNRA